MQNAPPSTRPITLNYAGSMLDQIRALLKDPAFTPFKVKQANGISYSVPTPDHAWITPGGLGGV